MQIPFWILSLVPLLFFLAFKYLPMFGLTMAFQDYKAGQVFMGPQTKWVGFKWFQKLFSNPNFGRWIKNTLFLTTASFLISMPMAIGLALLLNEINHRFLKKFTSNVSLLPHFISTVVIVGMLYNMFSVDTGIVNQVITAWGGKPINFMADPNWFRPLYIGSGLWQSTGFSAVVYTAAISGIDPVLYEAAAIDGSTRFKNMIRITIPCILPTIITMAILKVGHLMSTGSSKIILMYSPATYSTADTLSTYAYRVGLIDGKMSYATAIGLFDSIVNVILLVVANRLAKKYTSTSLY